MFLISMHLHGEKRGTATDPKRFMPLTDFIDHIAPLALRPVTQAALIQAFSGADENDVGGWHNAPELMALALRDVADQLDAERLSVNAG